MAARASSSVPTQRSLVTGAWRHDLSAFLRLFLALYLPLAAALIGFGWLQLRSDAAQRLTNLQTTESARLEIAARLIDHDIASVTSDLLVLAHAPQFQRYLDSGRESYRESSAALFRTLAQRKGLYDQIRYLDAQGRERIRVNLVGGKARVVPEEALQDKGQRYYFKDSLRLPAGGIYVSPLDLNIEGGALERPYKPMLRVAAPVSDSHGRKAGVVILNYLGQALLNHFRDATAGRHYAMLLNRDGYWLSAPRPSLAWGFMFRNGPSFAHTSPEAWRTIAASKEGSFFTGAGLYTYTTVFPLNISQRSSRGSPEPFGEATPPLAAKDYFWKAVTLVPANELPSARRLAHPFVPGVLGGLLAGLALLVAAVAASVLSRRRWREAVFENETRLRELTATLGEGVYVLDADGLVTYLNPEAERLLGWSEAELLGRNGHDTFHYRRPDGTPISAAQCPAHRTMERGTSYRSLNDWVIRKDGSALPVSIVSAPIVRDGRVYGSVSAIQDIRPRLKIEAALRASEEKFRHALEDAPIGMAILSPEGRFLEVNRALCEIVGREPQELAELSHSELVHPDDREADLGRIQQLVAGDIDFCQVEQRYLGADGSEVQAELTASAVPGKDGAPLYLLAQVQDVTERRQDQERIRQLAYYDTLTELPNRRLLLDHFHQALSQAKRHQRSMALMFLDLDQFKQVNDELGHEVGDQLLKEVATRLHACVRAGDTVSRQGGDEFVVLLAEISRPADAAQVAEKILAALQQPAEIQGHPLELAASIGIALYPSNGNDEFGSLLKQADIAMYSAKAAGRNCYRFFEDHAAD